MRDQPKEALNYESALDERLTAQLVEAAKEFTRALCVARDEGLLVECVHLPGGISVMSVRRSTSLWPRTGDAQ